MTSHPTKMLAILLIFADKAFKISKLNGLTLQLRRLCGCDNSHLCAPNPIRSSEDSLAVT